MNNALFQLQMIDNKSTTFHMQDFHTGATPIDEYERIPILNIKPHLVGDNTAQCIKALSHIRRMRIEEEPV